MGTTNNSGRESRIPDPHFCNTLVGDTHWATTITHWGKWGGAPTSQSIATLSLLQSCPGMGTMMVVGQQHPWPSYMQHSHWECSLTLWLDKAVETGDNVPKQALPLLGPITLLHGRNTNHGRGSSSVIFGPLSLEMLFLHSPSWDALFYYYLRTRAMCISTSTFTPFPHIADTGCFFFTGTPLKSMENLG